MDLGTKKCVPLKCSDTGRGFFKVQQGGLGSSEENNWMGRRRGSGARGAAASKPEGVKEEDAFAQ